MKIFRLVTACAAFFSLCLPVWAGTGNNTVPPLELKSWYDYALKRFPPMDCPWLSGGITTCTVMTELAVVGDAESGKLSLSFSGENFSRTEQDVELVGPASTFAIESATIQLEPGTVASAGTDDESAGDFFVSPFFDEADGSWMVTVPSGSFKVTLTIDYDPEAIVPIAFASGVGRMNVDIKNGELEFDENVGRHGGIASILTSDTATQEEHEEPRLRVTRVFHWGSVVTFTYEVAVDGIRNEASVLVPLLSGEVVEGTDPPKPFTIETAADGHKYVQITAQPSQNTFKVKGHFDTAPHEMILGDDLPFEVWLHEADTRHPVTIESTANPIDPGEFSRLADLGRTKAFLVRPGQKLTLTAINLARDEGRKGQGSVDYMLTQGQGDYWLEKLFLKAKLISQDRLTIPTPAPPIYAGIGGEGLELYHDEKKNLSVRIPASGLSSRPVEVDWQQYRKQNLFLSFIQAQFPPQSIYLENQSASLSFRPGMVPLLAWGADHISGDMRNQFHLYGLLIAVFAFFVCRQLRFSRLLSLLVAVLFVGLYLEPNFPTTIFLVLLLATIPCARVSDDFIQSLSRKRFRRFLLLSVWIFLFVITTVPLAIYGRVRVFQALHPYDYERINLSLNLFSSKELNRDVQEEVKQMMADQLNQMQSGGEGYSQKEDFDDDGRYQQNAYPSPAPNVMTGGMVKDESEEMKIQAEFKKKITPKKYGSYSLDRKTQQKEWNPRPVNIVTSGAGGHVVRYDWYHLLENQPSQIRAVIAGPCVRGAWMLVEVGIILWALVCVVKRATRVFAGTGGAV